MKRQFSILLHLFLLLALSACEITTAPTPTAKPSRLPDPTLVKELLVRIIDEEKRVPGIVVGMITDNPQNAGWSVMAG